MSPQTLYTLLAAAVLAFWMVGAYNRLVALRNAIGQAWAKVDEAVRLRGLAATPLLAALREPLQAEQGALDALQTTLAETARLATVMRARPVVEAHAQAWLGAEALVAAASARVFALLDQHPALRQDEIVTGSTQGWQEAQAQLAFARQLFNEAAQVYNAAIALFPTRLLVPFFRFGRAGKL